MAAAATILVLQNEYYTAYKEQNVKLKTSVPEECNVFTLHNKECCVGTMAHTDKYTDIVVTFRQINENLKKNKMDLSSGKFTAKIMGGTDQKYSVIQKTILIDALKSYKITFEQVELPQDPDKRPQIVFETQSGGLTFLYDKQVDGVFEFVQRREHGEFYTFLEKTYAPLAMLKLSGFESTEAHRKESDLPKVSVEAPDLESQVKILLRLEAEKKIQMPPLKPERKEVILKDQVITSLKEKIQGMNHENDCRQAIDAENFNLVLRQLAAEPSVYDKAFTFLFDKRHILDIDIYSRGITSGNALDIAEKKNNKKAIAFLKTWY